MLLLVSEKLLLMSLAASNTWYVSRSVAVGDGDVDRFTSLVSVPITVFAARGPLTCAARLDAEA